MVALGGELAPVRRIEVGAEPRVPAPEIRIAPGRSTTFFFDARILPDELSLEGRERFQRLGISDDHLALVPSSALREGERLRLGLRFRDGAAPEQVTFVLVVDAVLGEPQVEVYRRARSVESYRQEVEELKGRLSQARFELDRLQLEGRSSGGVESLVAALENPEELAVRPLTPTKVVAHPEVSVSQSRFVTHQMRWRAIRVDLRALPGGAGWVATGASLTDARGRSHKVLSHWQTAPLREDVAQALVVRVDHTTDLDPGHYVLKLWDAKGRTVTLEGLSLK
nr:DUF2381 family protein [Myxococcus sp. CA040A]